MSTIPLSGPQFLYLYMRGLDQMVFSGLFQLCLSIPLQYATQLMTSLAFLGMSFWSESM